MYGVRIFLMTFYRSLTRLNNQFKKSGGTQLCVRFSETWRRPRWLRWATPRSTGGDHRRLSGEPLYRQKDAQELPRPQAEQAGLLRLPLRVLSYDSLRSPIPAIQRRNRVGSGLYLRWNSTIRHHQQQNPRSLLSLRPRQWRMEKNCQSPVPDCFRGPG